MGMWRLYSGGTIVASAGVYLSASDISQRACLISGQRLSNQSQSYLSIANTLATSSRILINAVSSNSSPFTIEH